MKRNFIEDETGLKSTMLPINDDVSKERMSKQKREY
jgi:hypothetical protein